MPVEEIERSDHTVTLKELKSDGSVRTRRTKTVKCALCDKPQEEWEHSRFPEHLEYDHSPEDL